jgi:hypothetical protein
MPSAVPGHVASSGARRPKCATRLTWGRFGGHGGTCGDSPDRRWSCRPRRANTRYVHRPSAGLEPWLCPRCGDPRVREPAATSRADDRTGICPACGIEEALRAAKGLGQIPVAEWPVARCSARRGPVERFEGIRAEFLAVVERVGRTLAPGDDWMPVLLIEGRSERTIVGLGDLLSSEATKTFAAEHLMPALLRQAEAQMFGLVITAWLTKSTEAELPLLPPSQDPARVEAVVLTVADAQRHEVWLAEIRRRSSAPPTLGHWERTTPVAGLLVEPLLQAIAPDRHGDVS